MKYIKVANQDFQLLVTNLVKDFPEYSTEVIKETLKRLLCSRAAELNDDQREDLFLELTELFYGAKRNGRESRK